MPSRLLPPATALLWVGLVWLGITASHFLLARQVELAGQVSEIQSQSDRHGRFWTVTVQGSGWSNTTRSAVVGFWSRSAGLQAFRLP